MGPNKGVEAPLITRRALNRALLARQMLLERAPISALEAIERLAGIQSQAPNPPYFGLWSRVRNFQPDDLAILIVERRAVRLALMRSTIHLVSSADAIAWRRLIQPVMDRMYQSSYGHYVEGLDRADLHVHGLRHLVQQPLTFQELGNALLERWPDRDSAALANAIRTSATLVQVPPRGLWGQSGQARHTTIETWLGESAAAEPDISAMALRYLAAFGPAGVRDLQTWSGLTKLQPLLESLRPSLVNFKDENGRELFDLPDAPRPDEETPAPVRFLAEWDNMLLSYADPNRIVSPDDRKRVMSINGIVTGTILIDGFVQGTWSIKRDKSSAALVATSFGPIEPASQRELEDEGAALLAFAAPDLEHQITINVASISAS